ncbi:MAG: hypothetical protein U1F43_03305 [Myxococcota bacterium]
MRYLILPFIALGSLAPLAACDGYYASGTPAPEPIPQTPGPYVGSCDVGYSCDGSHLDYCDGSTLETWSCDDVCRSQGFDYSTGCGFDAGTNGDTCFCDVNGAGQSCPIDGPTCSGSNTVDSCDAYGNVTTWNCDALCQDQGFDYSQGCAYEPNSGEDACLCADAAPEPACYPSDVACTGAYTIETCGADGYPIVSDCDAVCQSEGFDYSAGCGFDNGSRSDACFCQ